MKLDTVIYIDGIGEIKLRRSNKAHYLNISIRPFIGVRVSVPIGMSYNYAEKLVKEKKNWIVSHLEKIKCVENLQTQFHENTPFTTREHKLILKQSDKNNISVRVSEGEITVLYPAFLKSESKKVQASIRIGIEHALKIEAKKLLPPKVNLLASKFSFEFNKLTLKNIKSRWGSCSRNKNINLSIHLMRLPDQLVDYVILHELVHTVEHNHSKRFWALLDSVTGNAKILDKELRNHRIAIY
jgi:predicted metal-dependent hydrolase